MPRKNSVHWHQSKDSPGRWRFSKIDATGKRRYYYASPEIPRTEAGRRKADAWMHEVLGGLADKAVTTNDWTLDGLRLAYLAWCKRQVASDDRSQHTLDGHRKHLNLICDTARGAKTFGDIYVRELNTRIVAELVDLWENPPDGSAKKGPTTIRNRIASLQAMLNWAARPRDDRPIERLIPSNPIAGYELPKPAYQGDRYAPAEEVDAFLAWLDERAAGISGKLARFERMTALLIRMAAETGCRPGELCVLQWEHLNAEKAVVILPPKLHKTGRTTNKPRIIILTRSLVDRLEQLRADPERHPTHVFTHMCGPDPEKTEMERRQGNPWDSNVLSGRVKRLRRQAIKAGVLTADSGIKRMHLYRLRHTKITNDLQKGANAIDIAAMSGNSVKVIESTYLHHQLDHLRSVVDRLTGGDSKEGT